jgi:hypothetical protein
MTFSWVGDGKGRYALSIPEPCLLAELGDIPIMKKYPFPGDPQ